MNAPFAHPSPPARGGGLLLLTLMALLTLFCTPVLAQEPPVAKLSDAQTQAINDALDLARAGERDAALKAFDALLAELDMDLLHLNRGRVLQKMGRCSEAREAFDRVLNAPRDPNVSRKAIKTSLERFRQALESECPGQIIVQCAMPEMTVAINGGPQRPCDGKPVELLPGEHEVVGTAFGQRTTAQVTLRGTYQETVSLALEQQDLVAVGRALMGQQNYQRATEIFEEVLRQQPSQAAYLYIVESLIGQHQCQGAFVALEEAPEMPPTSALSPVEFSRKSEDLRQAFGDVCGEPVQVTCKPAQMTLFIDGGAPQVCSPRPIFLKEGKHTLTANLASGTDAPALTVTRNLTVVKGAANRVQIDLSQDEALGELGWWGIGTAATGAVVLGTALVLDLALIGPAQDDFDQDNQTFRDLQGLRDQRNRIETLQLTNTVLLATGGAMVLTGAGLLTFDLVSSPQSPAASSAQIGAAVTGDLNFVYLRGVW